MSDTSNSNGLSVFLIFIIIAIFSSIIMTALTHKSKEEVMAERIVILEQAKNSTDPAVLTMAKSIKDEIAKEQEKEEQSRIEKEQRNKFFEENKLVIILASMIFNVFFLFFVFKIFNRN